MPKSILLLCCVLVHACAPLPAPPAPAAAPPADTYAGTAAAAQAVLDVGNEARADIGVAPLREDVLLSRAAAEYARELAERRVLSHTSATPGRRTISERVDAVGVRWSLVAENLASTSRTLVHVPRETIDMWLASPGHRSSLLDPRYTLTGVGLARDRLGMWYIVQLYVTPRR